MVEDIFQHLVDTVPEQVRIVHRLCLRTCIRWLILPELVQNRLGRDRRRLVPTPLVVPPIRARRPRTVWPDMYILRRTPWECVHKKQHVPYLPRPSVCLGADVCSHRPGDSHIPLRSFVVHYGFEPLASREKKEVSSDARHVLEVDRNRWMGSVGRLFRNALRTLPSSIDVPFLHHT